MISLTKAKANVCLFTALALAFVLASPPDAAEARTRRAPRKARAKMTANAKIAAKKKAAPARRSCTKMQATYLGGGIMKKNDLAAKGVCLFNFATNSQAADDILALYNVKTQGAQDEERIALANGLFHLTVLNGEVFHPADKLKVSFENRAGASRYAGMINVGHGETAHLIQMNRCTSKGQNCHTNNVAHMMHEVGHRIGNALVNGRTLYDRYRRAAGKCYPTCYSRKNLHEQFSETFSAFITRPDLLKDGDPDCKAAYAFFAHEVFKLNGRLAVCDPKREYYVRGAEYNIQTVSAESAGRGN